MEVLKCIGINVRIIELGNKEGSGHFLCEAHYNNSWRLHDVTKESHWQNIYKHHESMENYLSYKDSLYAVYKYSMSKSEIDKIIKKVTYGSINTFPAKNMLLFQRVTKISTYLLSLILLLLGVFSFKVKYK